MIDNQKKIEKSLNYWLHAIELKAPDSSVIVVGTHLDQIGRKSKELPSNIITKFSKLITLSIAVSCKTGEGINQLRDNIISLSIKRQIDVPLEWIQFGNELSNQSNGKSFIEMENVKKLSQSTFNFEDNILSIAIQVLHNIGYLLYYPPSSTKDINIIILDPQWLVNILKAVITVNEVPGIKNGWISHNTAALKSIWPFIEPSMHSFLLELLYRFRIAIKSKNQSLIPCQLQPVPPSVIEKHQKLLLKLEFTSILPDDIFPTFIASPRVYQYIDLENNQIWKDAAILEDEDKKKSVFIQVIGKSIELFGEKTSNILMKVGKIIIKVISKNWPG